MIGDHGGVGLAQSIRRVGGKAGLPARQPGLEGGEILEKWFEAAGVAGGGCGEAVEGQRPIGALHRGQQVFDQGMIAGILALKRKFGAHDGQPVLLIASGDLAKAVIGNLDRLFAIGVDQGDQGFGQAGEVPAHDAGLIGPGIAALTVDRGRRRCPARSLP